MSGTEKILRESVDSVALMERVVKLVIRVAEQKNLSVTCVHMGMLWAMAEIVSMTDMSDECLDISLQMMTVIIKERVKSARTGKDPENPTPEVLYDLASKMVSLAGEQ